MTILGQFHFRSVWEKLLATLQEAVMSPTFDAVSDRDALGTQGIVFGFSEDNSKADAGFLHYTDSIPPSLPTSILWKGNWLGELRWNSLAVWNKRDFPCYFNCVRSCYTYKVMNADSTRGSDLQCSGQCWHALPLQILLSVLDQCSRMSQTAHRVCWGAHQIKLRVRVLLCQIESNCFQCMK